MKKPIDSKSLSLIAFVVIFLYINITSCESNLNDFYDLKMQTNKEILVANNEDYAIITLQFGKILPEGQIISVSTTAGQLFNISNLNWENGQQQIDLEPKNNSIEIIIRANNEVNENVILTASYNELTIFKEIQFIRACPSEINIHLNEVSNSNESTSIHLDFNLFSQTGIVSNKNRFEVKIFDKNDSQLIRSYTPFFIDSTFASIVLNHNFVEPDTFLLKVNSKLDSCEIESNEVFSLIIPE